MLFWNQAPRIYKAKGHTLTTVADALEAKFGTGKKLGRTSLSLLVTTQCEPCPPEVERFIRDELEVKDPEGWAEYLAKAATEPPEEDAASFSMKPRDFRDVAGEVAREVAGTVRSWLDAFGDTLGTFITFARSALSGISGKLDSVASALLSVLGKLASTEAKLDAVNGKLDGSGAKLATLEATLNHVDAKVDLLVTWLEDQKVKRDKPRGTRRGLGAWVFIGLGVLGLFFSGRVQLVLDADPGVMTVAEAALRAALSALNLGKNEPKEFRIPKEPFSWQKLAKDCKASLGEVAINGGCWVPLHTSVKAPPCGELFRHGDICYRPVAADPQKPVGLVPNSPGGQ